MTRDKVLVIIVASLLFGSNLITWKLARRNAFVKPKLKQSTPDDALRSYFEYENAIRDHFNQISSRYLADFVRNELVNEWKIAPTETVIDDVEQQTDSRAIVYSTQSVVDRSGEKHKTKLRHIMQAESGKWLVASAETKCNLCDEDQVGKCSSCHGNGKCSLCDGTGEELFLDKPCQFCTGGKCDRCKGTGDCSYCDGDGWS